MILRHIKKGYRKGIRYDCGTQERRRKILPEENGESQNNNCMKRDGGRHTDKDTNGHPQGNFFRFPLETYKFVIDIPISLFQIHT